MADAELFIKDIPYIIIAEVTRGRCKLNGPWTEPQKENLQRVLRTMGAFRKQEIEIAARAVYESGMFLSDSYHFTLACFGKDFNSSINRDFPVVPQILWDNVLEFIYNRFKKYPDQKASHGQWDKDGKNLWNSVWNHENLENFKTKVSILDR